jgi:radical SAM superfamily enzyme YgiQ (UPF0313 family)
MRTVVLYSPPYKGKVLGPPAGLLSLAAYLREAGYRPRVIDSKIETDCRRRIQEEIEDCCCFGISLLTGPMIRDAIEVGRMVKHARPDLPIVLGGWHSSLATAQTLQEDFADIVVRHQGELTLVEILKRLELGQTLDLVAGCWFKRGGRIVQNPDRPATAISSLPQPAYDLVDFDKYERVGGERKLPYASSIGCPYACNYCTDMVFYNRRFNALTADRVVSELSDLVPRYRIDEVSLLDSNFLVDIRRALAIARGILDCKVRFRWTFQASTDFVCRMSDDEMALLAASGLRHIGFGTESASPEVLRWMEKRHQKVEDMYGAAEKCARAGIRVTFNLIFGYPGEEEQHRKETLRVMSELSERFDNASFSPNLFTPYPGIPIWPELLDRGMVEPRSLAEWAKIDLGANNLPWLRGKSFRKLDRGIRYLALYNKVNRRRKMYRSRMIQRALDWARTSLRWRIRHMFFAWPVELWVSGLKKRISIRRSLLTGQALSDEFARSH